MSKIRIMFDGGCPVCNKYVELVRLRLLVKEVELIDLRQNRAVLESLFSSGIDVDKGMVIDCDGVVYDGAKAVNVLALMTSKHTILGRLHAWVFRSPSVSKFIYPMLVIGRSILLKLMGRSKLYKR